MKWKKILIFSVLLVLTAAGVGAYFFFKDSGKTEFVTTTAEKGTLVQTVEANGVLESLDKVDLSFGSSGIVSLMLAEVGNEVRVGDLLAALDTDELQAQAEYYNYAASISQANLDKEIAGSTEEEIFLYEAKVTSAKTTLAVAKTDLVNQELDNTEILSESYSDLIQVLKDSVVEVRSALSEADNVLGIDNSMANDDYQDVLAANDWGSLQSAKYYYPLAKEARDQAEDSVFVLSVTSTVEEIEAATILVKNALEQTATTLLYVRRALDGTNISSATFSSSDLTALETVIDTKRTNIETRQTALTSQEQVIAQLKISNQTVIDATEGLVEKYENALAEAEATLEQVKAGPREVDLEPLRAAVAQANANYAAALARLNDSQILSPINGKVTVSDFAVGERITALTPAITVQSTSEQFQIKTDISESDISKISLSDTVEVTFDAFGDDQKFIGQVTKIDPAEKTIEGVTYYEVTVVLDDTKGKSLKPGLTANVTITTENLADVLIVSQRAVLERTDGTKYVRIPDGQDFKEIEVVTGIRGDGGLVQLVSGLEQGQEIIVTIKK